MTPPTQLSRTVRGGKRDAQRLAAQLELSGGNAKPAGRSVSEVLDEWVKQNLDTWAPSSARDQQSRVKSLKKDQIARLPLARLTVADIERWHTRLRAAGMADAGIKNQHGVLRAALSQAMRWGWVSSNVASLARLRSTKTQQRSVMTVDDVRAVMTAAASIDAAAELAFRIAAVAGARRAELASLRWTDEHDGQLLIDSAIEITKRGDGAPELREAATKTANVRTVTLDADTVEMIDKLRRAREPYGPWMCGLASIANAQDVTVWRLDLSPRPRLPRASLASPLSAQRTRSSRAPSAAASCVSAMPVQTNHMFVESMTKEAPRMPRRSSSWRCAVRFGANSSGSRRTSARSPRSMALALASSNSSEMSARYSARSAIIRRRSRSCLSICATSTDARAVRPNRREHLKG